MHYPDEQYVFIEDVKNRANIARSAKHVKNGSKSKKCSLPSDHMTKKERNAMNGELHTINFNLPCTYEEFKELSANTKKEYIEHLISKYNARQCDIRNMLGVASHTIVRIFRDLHIPTRKNGKYTKEENSAREEAWPLFMSGAMDHRIRAKEELDKASEELNNALTQNDCDQLNDILHNEFGVSKEFGYAPDPDKSITIDFTTPTPDYDGVIDWVKVSDDISEEDDDEAFSASLERHIKSVVSRGLNDPHGDPEGLILKMTQLMELYFYDEVHTVILFAKEK